MEDFDFVLSEDFPQRTRKQLIALFYKVHMFKEWDGKTWKRVACHPISLVLNPSPFVLPDDPFAQDMYLAIYDKPPLLHRSRYFVTIEENIHHPLVGPHSAKLNIEVYPGKPGQVAGKHAWLGSMQIMCNFHSLKKVHAKLRRAIRLKQYFASESSLEQVIEFDRPDATSFEFR